MPINNHEELLYRLDERTADMKADIIEMRKEIAELRQSCKENYVSKSEFRPIQRAIYMVATLIVTTVVGTLLSLVVQKGPTL